MEHVFGSVPAILKEIDAAGDAVEPVVFAAWKRCVDGALAENVVPVRIESSRLIAAVPSETWRRNVADLGPALAAKLNAEAGSKLIKFIEFQVDAAAVREHRKRLNTDDRDFDRTSAAGEIEKALSPAAASISDDVLRDQFLAAAASSLARSEASGASE